MNRKQIILSTLVIFLAALFFAGTSTHPYRSRQTIYPSQVISCSPAANENFYAADDGKFIIPLPGWGNHSYIVSTKNDSAQYYFNQDMSMYYSYHVREAVASFKEAARFDSTCAMAYWGQALALGPGYNYTYTYAMGKAVPAAVALMDKAVAYANPKEAALIKVMDTRYDVNDSTDKKRKALNETYAASMKKIMQQYPDDLDIRALYIDAVMLIHAWDFWNNDGGPKAWTQEVVSLCESILKADPQHPAALHYYIHLTEASRHPQVALASADSLKKLFPGVAHMVHMASHEYERTGFYAMGVDVNERANYDVTLYDTLARNLRPRNIVYHYFAVEAYCALSGAMYEKGMPKAYKCRLGLAPDHDNTYNQWLYMMPEMAMVRLGKWQDILADTTTIDPTWTYAIIINSFAKGMAHIHTGNIGLAQKQLATLREKMTDTILKEKEVQENAPYDISVIAENILDAQILIAQKKYRQALSSLQRATQTDDLLIYGEPRDWMMPPRQYTGALLIKLNKPTEAEKVYLEDLSWNPGNGWSLLGMYHSLTAQGKTNEAEKYKAQYLVSFSHADVIPTASAY